MELKVKTPTFPEIIEFNFDELKEQITEKASYYMNLVYTEDQISDAKKDRANLNKFVKAMSDERIKIKKECLKPYEDFEKKIKELDAIVNNAIQNIDSQVKDFEEKKRIEKMTALESYFEGRNPFDWLKLHQIFNEKWLNASVTVPKATGEMDEIIERIKIDLDTLSNLPEFGFEAQEEYKRSLDLNKAIAEGQRMAEIQRMKEDRAKAFENAAKDMAKASSSFVDAVNTINETLENKTWLSFKAHLSVDDAKALNVFFKSRNIEFEKI